MSLSSAKQYGIYTAAAAAIVGVGAFGVWFFLERSEGEVYQSDGWNREVRLVFDGRALDEQESETETIHVPPLTETYTNSTYGFSLRYPAGFTVGGFEEGEGESIVIQNIEQRLGVQMYISPLEESVQLTAARIEQDIPDMTVEEPLPLQIGESDNGIAFLSENPGFGKSREVWFVFDGNLYQISTYASLDPLLQAILNTWEFTQ